MGNILKLPISSGTLNLWVFCYVNSECLSGYVSVLLLAAEITGMPVAQLPSFPTSSFRAVPGLLPPDLMAPMSAKASASSCQATSSLKAS